MLENKIKKSCCVPTWFIPDRCGTCFFMEWKPPDEWDGMRAFLKGLAGTLPVKPNAIVVISAP